MSRVIPTMLSVHRLNEVISRSYSKDPNNSRQYLPNLAIEYLLMATLNGINYCEDQLEIIKVENKDKYHNNSGPSGAVID